MFENNKDRAYFFRGVGLSLDECINQLSELSKELRDESKMMLNSSDNGKNMEEKVKKVREEINNVIHEPNYQHVGEDWNVGLHIALDIIDKYFGGKNESN